MAVRGDVVDRRIANPYRATDVTTVQVRRVPYPYRAMMAIANDVDEATWADFVLLHDFMNTNRDTALGRGLQLEISDSFFFYATSSPAKAPTFSYFEGCNAGKPAPWAEAMDRLIEAAYLDSLHTWGDFSRTGGFTRKLALGAAEVLRRHDRAVRVWINHGDACNEQLVGRLGWDDPASAHGHSDIAIDCGLRYFWTGAITSIVGQDGSDSWMNRLSPERLYEDGLRPLRKVIVRQTGLVHFFGNHLMRPATVRGRDVRVFQRYGYWNKPTAMDLVDVLAPSVLDRLEARGGFMALYTHLFRRPRTVPLAGVNWSPLAELARRHHTGRIQVTTISRLLTYVDTATMLQWTVRHAAGTDQIQITQPVSPEALQGITFYVPDPRRAVLLMGDEKVRTVANPPDHTGRASVSVPWRPLRYPDVGTVVDPLTTSARS